MVLCRTPALDGCAIDLFKFHPGKINTEMFKEFYFLPSLHVVSSGIICV